jgi:Xaa-Pro aminopeptidase
MTNGAAQALSVAGAMYAARPAESVAAAASVPSSGSGNEELERRHAAVRAGMAQHGVNCLLVPINENLTYLTGVATIAYGAYLLFPLEGEPTLWVNPISFWDVGSGALTSTRYAGGELAQTIRDTCGVADIRGVPAQDFVARIQEWCVSRGLQRKTLGIVGREYDFPRGGGTLVGLTGPAGTMSALLTGLSAALPEARIVDGTPILAAVRSRKSASEIVSLRHATDLADRCRIALGEALRERVVTDRDLFAAYSDTLFRFGGAGSWWFMLSVNSSAAPQLRNWRDAPCGRAIRPGDVVMAEIMPAWGDGYVGHAEATFVVGELAQPEAYRKVEAASLDSHREVSAALRAGARLDKIVAAADGPIAAAGYMRGAPVAYSLGLFGLEPPMMGLTEPALTAGTVEVDMALCVICHVFDPVSLVTVRTGSTQLITQQGRDCLNRRATPSGLIHVRNS